MRIKLSFFWYNILIIERVVVGISLVLMMDIYLAQLFFIAIFLFLAIVVFVLRPYKEAYHNYRFIANMAITIAILIVYLCYTATREEDQPENPIWLYMPLLVCGLLIICIVYNLFFLVYSIIKEEDS